MILSTVTNLAERIEAMVSRMEMECFERGRKGFCFQPTAIAARFRAATNRVNLQIVLEHAAYQNQIQPLLDDAIESDPGECCE